MSYEEQRAKLVAISNKLREDIAEYDKYSLSALDTRFKDSCNKLQSVLDKIKVLDYQHEQGLLH